MYQKFPSIQLWKESHTYRQICFACWNITRNTCSNRNLLVCFSVTQHDSNGLSKCFVHKMTNHVWTHRNPSINKKLEGATTCPFHYKVQEFQNQCARNMLAIQTFIPKILDMPTYVYKGVGRGIKKWKYKTYLLQKRIRWSFT